MAQKDGSNGFSSEGETDPSLILDTREISKAHSRIASVAVAYVLLQGEGTPVTKHHLVMNTLGPKAS